MNRNDSDRYGNNKGRYQSRRSEQYRHPERDRGNDFRKGSDFSFDDYGSSARGGYGNESYGGTFGNQGNEMGGSRNVSNYGLHDTSSTSNNYGNMGSYGGAQGFGSSRAGLPSQRDYDSDVNYNFDSGMGSPRSAREHHYSPAGHRAYGNERDSDQYNRGRGSDMGLSSNSNNRDLYGNDTSRRFQGSDQGRYDYNRDDFDSPNYGGSEGKYMGSGYDRHIPRGQYGSRDGNYGSIGGYDGRRDHYRYNERYREPYGVRNDSSEGYRYRSGSSDNDYIPSRNRNRSLDHDYKRERDFDRDY
ncbi:hypothetical protein ACFSKU_18890 [Pontibacter silvestris]|uniref:SWFGD domain-containing protein n=1 Tax=Pontibacter silvestris TaxID=2305183 RepID=A0ABW4X1X5_9BACT|nr:hypothetical protein [Pontibacter silvestris]MCC9135041.1 hypothetical protein [Pontibacter silvestris]